MGHIRRNKNFLVDCSSSVMEEGSFLRCARPEHHGNVVSEYLWNLGLLFGVFLLCHRYDRQIRRIQLYFEFCYLSSLGTGIGLSSSVVHPLEIPTGSFKNFYSLRCNNKRSSISCFIGGSTSCLETCKRFSRRCQSFLEFSHFWAFSSERRELALAPTEELNGTDWRKRFLAKKALDMAY